MGRILAMSKRNMERLHVLIIDDNQHMINIVKTMLRGFGIKEIYEAKDAIEGFDLFREEQVDFIIVDLQMDLLDGVDFIRLVRTSDDSPNPYIPILMLTAHSERHHVERARDAGTSEFCCKPITASELYVKVSSIINVPRAFVRTFEYFGPDRRRHDPDTYRGPERRDAGLDQTDELALLSD